jgi:hypothetical protein
MTTMIHDVNLEPSMSGSFGMEGRTRPRAATVSFRYDAPESPLYKPALSPPTSPPSLILPPVRMKSGSLGRSISRVSLTDERLASSAPSVTQFWPFEFEGSDMRFVGDFRTQRHCEDLLTTDFSLVEEDLYESNISDIRDASQGNSRTAVARKIEPSPCMDIDLLSSKADPYHFSASPILMSCLRDIAKTRRSD